ncbi:AI-2E family transporter [Rubrivirga sp. S365]|uniref:AI-2E family transporter n=1 Tax=Rubrivirga litoralis TaxID=3075598 RepID=A0ABU3BQ44_9BACT|nr:MULTISPECIES: AI-2E family transporter [unclassified Rubrivirga]MDT0631385.1 AI-2E family transporter [Rubrivirga sp. F394]MDT7855976.1 AI-2E family transporter [Rubrivirga sp. S365]
MVERPPRRAPAPPPAARAAPPSRLSTWAALAALAALVLVLWAAPDLAGLVVLGAVLAYLLVPVVNALERRGVGRTAGSVLVLAVITAALVAVAVLAVPVVFAQLTSLQARWDSGELLALVQDVEARLAARLSVVEASDLGLVRSVQAAVHPGGAALVDYVPTVLEAVGTSVVVPFVLFALLKDGPVLRRRVLRIVPNRYFEFAMTVAFKADAHLGGYLRGQALIALLVGVSTTIGLGLLGVDYYFVLGFVTGLANFVPYAGFVVSAGLSVLVSVVTTGGMGGVVPVLLLFAVLQTVENVVFQPWITGKNVSMHPALVLIAILVGGRVAGVFGMALAVPAAAVLKVFFVETAVSLRRYHL